MFYLESALNLHIPLSFSPRSDIVNRSGDQLVTHFPIIVSRSQFNLLADIFNTHNYLHSIEIRTRIISKKAIWVKSATEPLKGKKLGA